MLGYTGIDIISLVVCSALYDKDGWLSVFSGNNLHRKIILVCPVPIVLGKRSSRLYFCSQPAQSFSALWGIDHQCFGDKGLGLYSAQQPYRLTVLKESILQLVAHLPSFQMSESLILCYPLSHFCAKHCPFTLCLLTFFFHYGF